MFVVARHELWRDEVRALFIALSMRSPLDFGALQNEGHPALWYVLLHLAFQIFQTKYVLQALSIGIAAASVALMLFRGPFPLWLGAMFSFSVLPFYEYSVMARNYGISMLILFVFAVLYSKRRSHLLALGAALALLANTNVVGLFAAAMLAAVLILESWREAHGEQASGWRLPLLLSVTVAGAGIVLCLFTIWPDETNLITSARPSAKDLSVAILSNLMLPGRQFTTVLTSSAMLNVVIVWLLALGLLPRIWLVLAVIAQFALVGAFGELFYGLSLRHHGVVFVFLLTLYWMKYAQAASEPAGPSRESPVSSMQTTAHLILTILVATHLVGAYREAQRDLRHLRSSGKSLGAFLAAHDDYHAAILVGEPDYLLETLPFYVQNDIFVLREGRFAKWTRFTTASRRYMTLHELTDKAQQLATKEARPVLLVLGHDLAEDRPLEIGFGYGKIFSWSPAQLRELEAAGRQVAQFKGSFSDENYVVYEFIPSTYETVKTDRSISRPFYPAPGLALHRASILATTPQSTEQGGLRRSPRNYEEVKIGALRLTLQRLLCTIKMRVRSMIGRAFRTAPGCVARDG
jgi:hypothetical protein